MAHARIETVDYEKMAKDAEKMRARGKDLNTEITSAYTSLREMKKSWHGIRYNELVKAFNKIIPSLDQLLTLVVTELPYALECFASNYAVTDRGKGIPSSRLPAKKLPAVELSNEVGLRFMANDVRAIKQSISKNFDMAKKDMDDIERIYKQINWKSEAADEFRTKFTKLKASIVESFNDIEKKFSNLMQLALKDMETSERLNTLK